MAVADRGDPRVSGVHWLVTRRQSTMVGQRYLADGEISGETNPTYVTYSLSRID